MLHIFLNSMEWRLGSGGKPILLKYVTFVFIFFDSMQRVLFLMLQGWESLQSFFAQDKLNIFAQLSKCMYYIQFGN